MATSTPFIQKIANSVLDLIKSAGELVISKLSAKVAYFERVEAEVVAIKQGMEIVDQATSTIYCVTIKNGDWSKVAGVCPTAAMPVTTPVNTPSEIVQQASVVTGADNLSLQNGTSTPNSQNTSTSTPNDTAVENTSSPETSSGTESTQTETVQAPTVITEPVVVPEQVQTTAPVSEPVTAPATVEVSAEN